MMEKRMGPNMAPLHESTTLFTHNSYYNQTSVDDVNDRSYT